jgi:hypothetical protein
MRFAVLALMISACTSSMPAGGDDDDATSLLGFTPSNFDVTSLDVSNLGDLVFADESTWQTDLGGLLGAGQYNYQVIPQANGLSLGVFTVNSVELSPNARIHVRGVNALVIVALDSITIDGELDANSQVQGAWTGPGGSAASDSDAKGIGAGGGGAGTPSAAGGGGGFCGVGGSGGSSDTAPSSAGPSYGTASLSPLVAGSQGGSGNLGNGGAGGGAIQLVARNSISISGTVHLGAEGGSRSAGYSMNNSQTASGGGSGGALLLESGSVIVTGTIAANGGGGGGYVEGADATADAIAAPGGTSTSATSTPGGDGAAANVIDGEDGPTAAAANGGGGGGAAGRIRINTIDAPSITGTLSPSTTTPCVTTSKVAAS